MMEEEITVVVMTSDVIVSFGSMYQLELDTLDLEEMVHFWVVIIHIFFGMLVV